MKGNLIATMLFTGLSAAAVAQVSTANAPTPAGGVRSSTDPARVAAVERRAGEVRAAARDQPGILFRGRTDSGVEIFSGGVSEEDRVAMRQEQARYSLWVATVAKPSGAYLARAKLRVARVGESSVALERTLEGPWLFAALPPGKYDVTATFKARGSDREQTLNQRVTVPASGVRQVVLRFDSSAQVGAEMDSPLKGNPFGDARTAP